MFIFVLTIARVFKLFFSIFFDHVCLIFVAIIVFITNKFTSHFLIQKIKWNESSNDES